MRHRKLRWATFGVAALLCTTAAHGQRKPDPKPYVPPAPAGPDIETWKAAYESAGEPRVMLVCGMSTPDGMQRGAGLGSTLTLYDPSGDAQALQTNIREVLLRNSAVDMVHPESLSVEARREAEILLQSDELRAIALMGTQLDADFYLVIKMIPRPAPGVHYRVIVEGTDVARGIQVVAFTFDWKDLGRDAFSIKQYAQAVARKIIDGFDQRYRTATLTYDVVLFGLADPIEDLMMVRDSLASIPGVVRCRARGGTSVTGQDGRASSGRVKVEFIGSALELAYQVQKVARDGLGMEIDTSDFTQSTIMLVAKGDAPRQVVRPRWENLTVYDDAPAKQVQQKFFDKYRVEGSPSIGVLVNRELTDQALAAANDAELRREVERVKSQLDGGNAPTPGGPSPVLVYMPVNIATDGSAVNNNSGNVGGGRPPVAAPTGAIDFALNTTTMEDAVYKRLNHLRLNMRDPNMARDKLRQEQEKAAQVFPESELPFLLGRQAEIDVMILGLGQVVPGRSVSYTFRAVRTNDGRVLASTFWRRDLSTPAERELDQTTEQVAAFIAGDLADQLWRAWEPPRTMSMTIQDAQTQADVMMIREALLDNIVMIDGVRFERHDAGAETGVGYLTIEYDGSLEELQSQIIGLSEKLPFELDNSTSTRDTIAIRIRGA